MGVRNVFMLLLFIGKEPLTKTDSTLYALNPKEFLKLEGKGSANKKKTCKVLE